VAQTVGALADIPNILAPNHKTCRLRGKRRDFPLEPLRLSADCALHRDF
jgi:hypothetical protein